MHIATFMVIKTTCQVLWFTWDWLEKSNLSMGPWDHRSPSDFLFNKIQSTSTFFWSTDKSSWAVTTNQAKQWGYWWIFDWRRQCNMKLERKKDLVLVPLVFSAVSPFRRAKAEGFRLIFALSIIAWHCSALAKFGKYIALGFQLSTCHI